MDTEPGKFRAQMEKIWPDTPAATMSDKIRMWVSDGFLCVHVDDGVCKATVSLNVDEIRKLYADAHESGAFACVYSVLRPAR